MNVLGLTCYDPDEFFKKFIRIKPEGINGRFFSYYKKTLKNPFTFKVCKKKLQLT